MTWEKIELKPKCDNCGDTEQVYVRLIAYYDPDEAVWNLEKFNSEVHCGACGNEAVDLAEQFLTAEVRT